MSTEPVNVVDLPTLHSVNGSRGGKLGTRLDLIDQLKVRVQVVAGSVELPAATLFALGSGDVLPLQQSADSPVDLYMNEKMIARGVLVASGDRLGVRIIEVNPE